MTGFYTVFRKELEDSFNSWRFIILFTLVLLAGVVAIYIAWSTIRSTVTGSTEFVFLSLFTTSGESFPLSFLSIMSILIPLIGIVLGLDAINSEKNNGTLSRLMSQPIYRDSIINAKFLAGVVTISIMVTSVVLLISGLGLGFLKMGVGPSAEEAWRLLFFIAITIIYGSFWLGLSILFSILFRRVATSALAVLAVWVFFSFFYTLVAGALANVISPPGDTMASLVNNAQLAINLSHVSPYSLFNEAMMMVMVPGARTSSQLVQIYSGSSQGLLATPLSLVQSLLQVWPLIITIILLTVICFAISYIRFMREEIRAT
jgi:ABC-2 type transport system permease protein